MIELAEIADRKKIHQEDRAAGDPHLWAMLVLLLVHSRSCLLSELGEGVLRQLDNSLCPNATHNLQGLCAGQLGAASVAAPPAGIFCSQPSAVLPCLEQPCEDHSTAAATPGSSALLLCHLRLLSVQVSERGRTARLFQDQHCALGQLPGQTECFALLS